MNYKINKKLIIIALLVLLLLSNFVNLVRAEEEENIIDPDLVENVQLKEEKETYDITRHILADRKYLFLGDKEGSKIKINLIREDLSKIIGKEEKVSRLIKSNDDDQIKLSLEGLEGLKAPEAPLNYGIYFQAQNSNIILIDKDKSSQFSNYVKLSNTGNSNKEIKKVCDILRTPLIQTVESGGDISLTIDQNYTRNIKDYPLDTGQYYIYGGRKNRVIHYNFTTKLIGENKLDEAKITHKVKKEKDLGYVDSLYLKDESSKIVEGETIIDIPQNSYPTSIKISLENSNKTGKNKQEDLLFEDFSLYMVKGEDKQDIVLDQSMTGNKKAEINLGKELDDKFYDWIAADDVKLILKHKTNKFSPHNAGVDQKAKVEFFYYDKAYPKEAKAEIYNQVTTDIVVHKIYLERENLLDHNQKTEKDENGNIYIENKDGKYGYLDEEGKLNKEKAKEIGLEGESSNKEDNYFGKHDKLEGVLFRLEDDQGKMIEEKRTGQDGKVTFQLDNSIHSSKVRIVEVREESSEDYYIRVKTGEKIKRNLVARADDLEIIHPIYNDNPEGIEAIRTIDLYPKNTLDESLIRKRLVDKNSKGKYSYRSDNNYDMGENIYWSLEALIPRGFNLNWAQIIDRPGNGLMVEEIEKIMVNGEDFDSSYYSWEFKEPSEDAGEEFSSSKDLVITIDDKGREHINKLNLWEKDPKEPYEEDYKDYSKIQVIVKGKIRGDKYLDESLEFINRAIYNYKFSKYKEEENQSTRVDDSLVKTGKAQLVKTNVLGETLEGAHFYLYKESFKSNKEKVRLYLNYKQIDKRGEVTWTEDENQASLLISDALGNIYIEGKIQLKGIKDGSYYLEEIKPPEGYIKLANPKRVIFSEDLQDQEQKIINTKYFMPETGGPGLKKRLGLALLVIGLATYFLYKRNKKKIDKFNKIDI